MNAEILGLPKAFIKVRSTLQKLSFFEHHIVNSLKLYIGSRKTLCQLARACELYATVASHESDSKFEKTCMENRRCTLSAEALLNPRWESVLPLILDLETKDLFKLNFVTIAIHHVPIPVPILAPPEPMQVFTCAASVSITASNFALLRLKA